MSVGIGPGRWPVWGRVLVAVLVAAAGGVWAADGMGAFAGMRPAARAVTVPVTVATVPAARKVTVEVTGGAQTASVQIGEGGAILYRSSVVPLPFTWTGNYDPSGGVTVNAQGFDGPGVACRVVLDGRLVSHMAVNGGPAICSG